mgnify:FL=1
MFKKLLLILSIGWLAGCAEPTVVDVVMQGDQQLTCGQLKNAYGEAARFKKEADSKKGFTGGNTVRALLFWPAIVGTHMNSNEAIQAADSRKVHLINVMRSKKCKGLENLN